jgi:DNA invertase Pin-like site-specific DNA recombinase
MTATIILADRIFGTHNRETAKPAWLQWRSLIDTAVIYARVSKPDQAKHGYSLETQERETARYLEARGVSVDGRYHDSGLRGWNPDRPGLRKAVDHAKRLGCPVVVLRRSRLYRKPLDPQRLPGGVFAVVKPLDESDATEKREASRLTLELKRDRGESLGGRPIYRNPDAIKMLVRLRRQGYTYQRIADSLNQAGFRSANRGRWNAEKARKLYPKWQHLR